MLWYFLEWSVRCKMWSSPQIFKTSSGFLEYMPFEARRAVFFSISAYEESKHAETLFTCRALYAFYSRCKISASEARMCAERKIPIFWVKKSWHFYLSLSLLPSFFFILFPFLRPENLLGRISVGEVLGNSILAGLEGRICRWVVEDFHHHFRVNVTYFLSFYLASRYKFAFGNVFHRF